MSENRLTKFPEILFKEDNIYIYIRNFDVI